MDDTSTQVQTNNVPQAQANNVPQAQANNVLQAQANNVPPARSQSEIIQSITRSVLGKYTASAIEVRLSEIGGEVLEECNNEIGLQNSIRPRELKFGHIKELKPIQVTEIMIKTDKIAKIPLDGSTTSDEPDRVLLAIYQSDGKQAGTYQRAKELFYEMIETISYGYPVRRRDEVIQLLKVHAPTRPLCLDPDLIAVNNGIFDYRQKRLLSFSLEYVFIAKCGVDYNEQAQNVVLHNDMDNTDWDVESWMQELVDDLKTVNLLWQILGAVIRPNVRWNKAAWFYSEKGNNGKGTFCELARGICGENTYVSLSLEEMGKEFRLEPLLQATAIITDENDVGTFIDKAANLKAIITGDMVSVNRKYKEPLTFRFRGFMIQCLNEMPKIRDKSDSFFRRQIFVLFDKCFTGKERAYIKNDYLKRKEVLEYVLYKVLNMNYYELNVPESCKKALEEYKEYVDPIRAFLKEMMPQFVWDMLPWGFLYDLYCAWYKRNNPGFNNGIVNKTRFINDVKQLIKDSYSDEWSVTGDNGSRPGNRMCVPEPLIYEYNLERWMNLMYKNDKDSLRACVPVLVAQYRGLYRNGSNVVTSVPGDTSNM